MGFHSGFNLLYCYGFRSVICVTILQFIFQILEELLKKLGVEHIVWCNDKNGYYYQVSLLDIKQSKDECD
jgi:hypothetical protein